MNGWHCDECGEEVRITKGSGTWVEATGWYPLRDKGRTANQMVLKKDTGRVRCRSCMDAIRSGVISPTQQGGLWDSPPSSSS